MDYKLKYLKYKTKYVNLINAQGGCDLYNADRHIVLKKVSENGGLLKYISEIFKNDLEVVSTAVENEPSSIVFASKNLQNNKILMSKVIVAIPYILGNFPQFSDSTDIVLAAVSKDGAVLQFASERLKNDKHIVFAAVKNASTALQYASDKLKNDAEFILSLVEINGECLKYVPITLQNDKLVFAAINQNPFAILSAPDKFKLNKNLILKLIKLDGRIADYTYLKKEPEIVAAKLEYDKKQPYDKDFNHDGYK